MTQSGGGSGKSSTAGTMLSQRNVISAGRQNLLSSLWGVNKRSSVQTMPNGDPPSLMLWGVEEDAGRRISGRQSRVHV